MHGEAPDGPTQPPRRPPRGPPAPPADLPVPAAESRAEEQQPRRVATARRARRSFSERVWGGQGSKPKRPKKVHKRVSLRGMAEDFFLDAAWTFQGLPPVEKIMYLQAPYAGQAVEDTVRGTRADRWLQPAARADQKVKQLEGLTAAGWVILIMVRGRRDEAGNYDPATKLMFSGLRHALLAMSRSVPDFSFERQREKAEELRSASGDIDAMIAYLFEMPEPTEEQLMEMARMQAQRAADASS